MSDTRQTHLEDAERMRNARRQAWEESREATRRTLNTWMLAHPGEEVDSQVITECTQDVRHRVEAVLAEQGRVSDHPSLEGTGGGTSLEDRAKLYVWKTYRDLRNTISYRKQRSEEEWSRIFPRYPKSVDGNFCRCYDPTDASGMQQALERYGLFVVKVMTDEEVDETIVAMFDEINQLRVDAGVVGPTITPTDTASWVDGNWPSKRKCLLSRPALHPIAFRNRCLESIQKVFAILFNEDRLHATVDNWGIGRGGAINPKWEKCGLKPHWDINPWCFLEHIDAGEEPGFQGLVALTDQTLETGCHLTLPGGVNFNRQWIMENPKPGRATDRKSKHADLDDPVVKYMQPIPLRKGEMIVWSWGQLHGSTDSHSSRMRLHQYIRMYPAPEAGFSYDYSGHDRYSCKRIIRRSVKDGLLTLEELERTLPDERSRRLLGLIPYPSEK